MNLTECLLALVLIAAVSVFVFAWTGVWQDRREAEEAAAQLRTVAASMERWLAVNGASVMASFGSAKAVQITLDDLTQGGYLRRGFPRTNVWRQPYSLWFYRQGTDGAGIYAAAVGTDRTGEASFRGRLTEAAGRLNAGFRRPDADTAEAMSLGAGQLAGNGRIRWDAADAGIPAEARTAGTLAAIPGPSEVDVERAGATNLLARVGEGGSGEPNPELNAMETDLDMDGNPMLGAAAVQLEKLADGLLLYNGNAVADLAQLKAACEADGFLYSDGSAIEKDGSDGFTVVDRETGMWRCAGGRLSALNDSGNAVQIKAAAYVSPGTVLPAPKDCPAGTVPAVYALPASTGARTDESTGNPMAEEAVRWFGTAVQEASDGEGNAVWIFRNAIDEGCPDGACGQSGQEYGVLAIAACRRTE